MKQTGFLKRYTPLKAKSGFKVKYSSLQAKTPLKRAKWSLQPHPTPQSELDSIVSKVVRLLHADSQGMVQCVTCPVILYWMNIQCGHFQKRGNLSTRYYIYNLGPQCEDCNCFHDGRQKEFAKYIDNRYGSGVAVYLEDKAKEVVQGFDYQTEIANWSAKLSALVEKRGRQIQY